MFILLSRAFGVKDDRRLIGGLLGGRRKEGRIAVQVMSLGNMVFLKELGVGMDGSVYFLVACV